MAKKRRVGRPQGAKKEPVNVSISSERAEKLRELAANEQRTISVMVENALKQTYNI